MEVGMITTTDIVCSYCGKKSVKKLSEINRQKKKGRSQFYCNRKCASNRLENKIHIKKYSRENFFKRNNNYGLFKIDEFTPFRYHLRNAKRRKNLDKNLDVQFLKELWESQNGRCAITGFKLKHRYLSWTKNEPKNPYQASLDRIDNNQGYIKGNVRFVCLMYNYARNNFSDEQTIEFFSNIKHRDG